MKNENRIQIFRRLPKGFDEEEKKRIVDAFYSENFIKMRWAALFALICQIAFIVRDSAAGFYVAHPLNFINLGAQLAIIVTSFILIIYSKGKHKEWTDSLLKRIIYHSYVVILVVCICCFSFTDMYVRHVPFGICLSFLMIFVIAPYFDLWQQITLFGSIFVFDAIAYFVSMAYDPLSVLGVLIFPALLFLTSCFLRSYYIENFLYDECTKDLTEKLIYRNKTDFLTDVSNRFCLYDDYLTAQKVGESVGIVMYDIDDFKKYNDAFSHIAGDDCLKVSSQAIKKFTSENNGKVYRYGGEEFVVIFFGISQEAFLSLVPQINNQFNQIGLQHASDALHPFVTISVGATYRQKPDVPVETLLLECDTALYEAKSNGKNCFVIYSSDNKQQ